MTVRFYEQYPMMEPFVGARFRERRQPAILLIGESHYLPLDSTVHLDEGELSQWWYRPSSAYGGIRPLARKGSRARHVVFPAERRA